MNRLALLLGLIAIGLLLLFINGSDGRTFGISSDDLASLVYLVPIAVLLGTGVVLSRGQIGRNLRYLLIWLVIALSFVAVYLYRDDAGQLTSRMAAELMPGHAVVLTGLNGENEVLIRRTHEGHFAVHADVDGKRLGMLIDTGASQVTLTWQDAERIGIDTDTLNFSLPVTTANGTAKAALVKIDKIAIGPIVRRNITATVAEKGKLDASLLGMNFLSTLSAVRMEPYEMRLMD